MEPIEKKTNFITNAIDQDIADKVYKNDRVHTRFPPEPNGYLHIGHAKASLLNYRIAKQYHGKFNLRFDDTNPIKEELEFVDSIKEDLTWLGIDWDDRLFFASSYFDKMADYAVELIGKGLAFVDQLSAEEMRAYRGTLTEPGKESPYRNRPIEENLQLFAQMKAGELPEGSHILRAKIDMASPNMNMRDPAIYRILHTSHHSTSEDWYIYPMYDYAHPIEDALEGITHSLCTLEFEDHRPFYDWVLANIDDFKKEPPRQIEFAKLNLTKTIVGKRFLKQLVEEKIVDGWDDPRLATISGLRRRGFTPESIQAFCEAIGVAKTNSTVDIAMLEHFIRDDLKLKAPRLMAVIDPLKVTITNYPENQTEWVELPLNQENDEMGSYTTPFSREILIDRSDFMEIPPKKYFRLFPGNEVRLRGAYFITCQEVIKDADGHVIELKCTYDPATKSGAGCERKVKGTIHWVDASHASEVELHLYDYLVEDDSGLTKDNFLERINPKSLEIVKAYIEPELLKAQPYQKFQFIRNGFFSVDPKYSTPEAPVFNQIVSLKSSWKPTN
ncbi:glutamine--tRNA ligase/YqeY domain fusion protein [Acetobacterium wieringae]|uniref:glutamine--tRNA ligase/YqeY domain fusion protein n=1 Tax=Acetobacterium wieringae TaxID=52694 RepID=UPI002B1ECD9A|nr:glutamine--tRNA ligase/YqeY domain fusion protein [Acetobacterium wieringae]MEA4806522.1 glutamine--tRNA ligase/YqeY domain fusion protein [Acetobacterium wieringae]